MEEKPNYYAIIPAEVRYDKRLKDKAKLLYGEITSLSDKYGYCYASNRYFANLYGISTTSISLIIKNLIDCGYIESKIIYKEKSKEIDKRYLILLKGGYLNNFKDPIKEKLKENNTSINNISTTITTRDNSKNIFEIIEENFGRTLNSIEYETIQNWSEYNFPLELLKYAVKKAVLKNIYNISYIDKILYEWNKNNIRTVAQAQKSDKEHENRKKQQRNQNYKHYKTRQEREEEAIAKFLSEPDD